MEISLSLANLLFFAPGKIKSRTFISCLNFHTIDFFVFMQKAVRMPLLTAPLIY